jgi:hypothetical protein
MIARPGFGAAVEMMTAGIAHHVEDEEEEAFPKLRQAFDADRLSSLGRTLMAEKQTAGMLVDSQSTKAELQEIAGELGIERRSSMTKDELKEAILAVS